MQTIRKYWPVILLLTFEGVLFVANYRPGTFLMGWDNVMPELNFVQALKTNLFGVWLEYRGLGLYDGMSHIANLVHTLAIWLFSLAVPTSLLRYSFTFLMHFAGGIGAYFLLKQLIDKNNAAALKLSIARWVALIGSLFYLLNPATIQMFYTPLEAFSVHFAALPWLALTLMKFLKKGSRRWLLAFLSVTLLSIPQYFVTTLLLPVALLLGSIGLASLVENEARKQTFSRVLAAAAGFLLINAFWLLPYLYGLPKNAPVIASAKINQMSSEEVYERNRAFGDIGNVLILRGFAIDFEDVAPDGSYSYLMKAWRDHWHTPFATLFSWSLVAIMLLGLTHSIVLSIKKFVNLVPVGGKLTNYFSFILIFFLGFFFLANDTPLIQALHEGLRSAIPFFAEAYRFPFTKFSLLFVFSYTVLLVNGLSLLATASTARSNLAVITVAIIGLSFPAFQGKFISPNLRVTLPSDYRTLFDFMKKQNPSGRVAILPQPAYWSWKFYDFGYRGSGFLWYGLSQPIMDRAFDPWSATNENYYWELTRALYSKDVAAFDAVLAKYDIRYVLLDEHLVSVSHNRSLFVNETKELLAEMPMVKEISRFGKLTVYEYAGDNTQSFVSVTQDLPTVAPIYRWTDNDVAYRELGDYIASNDTRHVTRDTWYTFPYRSLFTKRGVDEREFDIEAIRSKTDAVVYDSALTNDLSAAAVTACGLLKEGTADAQRFDESGIEFLRFTSRNQRSCLSFGVNGLPHVDSYLVEVTTRHITGRPLLFSLINQTAKHVELETYLESSKVKNQKSKVESDNWQTDYFVLPPLALDGLGYTVYLSNDSIGRQESINDIKSIKFYRIPYQELVSLKQGIAASPSTRGLAQGPRNDIVSVSHPNPAFYKVTMGQPRLNRGQRINASTQNTDAIDAPTPLTLVLSQSFDPGWIALQRINQFPFVAPLNNHVLINNWSNGWVLRTNELTQNERTIFIFFWPQLLEWIGFLLLPLPFLFRKRLAS